MLKLCSRTENQLNTRSIILHFVKFSFIYQFIVQRIYKCFSPTRGQHKGTWESIPCPRATPKIFSKIFLSWLRYLKKYLQPPGNNIQRLHLWFLDDPTFWHEIMHLCMYKFLNTYSVLKVV